MPGCLNIRSIVTRKREGVNYFHYYLCRQLKGGGMEIFMKQDLIVILDLGSTQNTVIAREIRDLGVYSEIHPHDITVDEVRALQNVKGIVLNGGENRVVDGQEVEISERSAVTGQYTYLVEPSVAMSGIYRTSERIMARKGRIEKIEKTEKGFYLLVELKE